MLNTTKERLSDAIDKLRDLATCDKVVVPSTQTKKSFELRKGDAGFERYVDNAIRFTEGMISQLKSNVKFFEKQLREWKPKD